MSMIFLTGMPASGKTYWGKRLAAACQLSFADLDKYIEQEQEESIGEIFSVHGEERFREIEAKALAKMIEEQTGIVACGGGTPAFGNNLELMKQAGCVVYLSASLPILVERITNDRQVRPLLKQSADLAGALASLFEARKPYYEQADYILKTENISLINFTEIVEKCTGRQL
jgi:shikimate kinase